MPGPTDYKIKVDLTKPRVSVPIFHPPSTPPDPSATPASNHYYPNSSFIKPRTPMAVISPDLMSGENNSGHSKKGEIVTPGPGTY